MTRNSPPPTPSPVTPDNTGAWVCFWTLFYLAGMWISGGYLYGEDAKCRATNYGGGDKYQEYLLREEACGDSMYLFPGTVGWPVYWFVRSSHEAFS